MGSGGCNTAHVPCLDTGDTLGKDAIRSSMARSAGPAVLMERLPSQVIFLDSDNVAVADPNDLFSSEEYRATGAILWPDYWRSSAAPDLAAILGVRGLPEGTFESGQMVFDKQRWAVCTAADEAITGWLEIRETTRCEYTSAGSGRACCWRPTSTCSRSCTTSCSPTTWARATRSRSRTHCRPCGYPTRSRASPSAPWASIASTASPLAPASEPARPACRLHASLWTLLQSSSMPAPIKHQWFQACPYKLAHRRGFTLSLQKPQSCVTGCVAVPLHKAADAWQTGCCWVTAAVLAAGCCSWATQ